MRRVRPSWARQTSRIAICVVAPISACSFFAPSVSDYAREPGASGSGGSLLQAGGTAAGGVLALPLAGSAGTAGTAGNPQAGTGGTSLGGGGAGDQAGAGGSVVEGTALSFSGSEMLRLGPPPTDDLTLELWLKTTMFGPGNQWFEGAAIFDADAPGSTDDFGATLMGDSFAFGTGNPDVFVLSQTPVNSGEWTHVAATREMATGIIAVFVNGQPETSLATGNTSPLTAALSPAIGGVFQEAFFNGFVGTIDEVRLWNVVRSNADIAANLHTRLQGNEPGLVGYWRFDDGAGLVAVDSSPSGHNGTLGDGHPKLIPAWVRYAPPVVP